MINLDSQIKAEQIHWGHFAIIAGALLLIIAVSWMEKPQLFSFKNNNLEVANANIPQYQPYVTPAADLPQPAVLGASTNQGPEIINDDGTVQQVDMGQVLAASTDGVQLSLDSVTVKQVPDSSSAITQYFTNAMDIENGFVGGTDFIAALNSGDQSQINSQAQKLTQVRDSLQGLGVPKSLVKLQKLKIIQYNSAIQLLQNFTTADSNPDSVNQNVQQFLTSQQDLDAENVTVAQEFPTQDPLAAAYIAPDGTPLPTQSTTIDSAASDAAQTLTASNQNQ